MIKHVALISLAVGLIMSRIVPLPFFREPPAYSLFTLDPVELARQKRLLAEQQKARNDFVEVREGILERLGQGKITLSDACDRIYFAAREIYPKYAGIICGNDKLDPKRYMACNVGPGASKRGNGEGGRFALDRQPFRAGHKFPDLTESGSDCWPFRFLIYPPLHLDMLNRLFHSNGNGCHGPMGLAWIVMFARGLCTVPRGPDSPFACNWDRNSPGRA